MAVAGKVMFTFFQNVCERLILRKSWHDWFCVSHQTVLKPLSNLSFIVLVITDYSYYSFSFLYLQLVLLLFSIQPHSSNTNNYL